MFFFMLAVHVSIGYMYVSPSTDLSIPTSFLFDNLGIYQQLLFKFCISTKNSSLRIVNVQF